MKRTRSLMALAIATILTTGCASEPQSAPQETAVSVETYLPTSSESGNLSVSGVLSSKSSASISTRMMAYVDKIYVGIGDPVQKGQLLVRLNANELLARKAQVQAQITEAELATRNAQRDYQRFETLHRQESVSDKELENMQLNKISMESKLQMAQQALKEVEAMLSYTQIKAPFSGVVTQKMADEGNMAQPGMPLLAIEQPGAMEINATIPENYIGQVHVGDSVNVEFKSIGQHLGGRVSELSPSSALSGGQYAMKIALDKNAGPQLRSGMYANVSLPGKDISNGKSTLWIDRQSLVVREQLKGVYVVNADHKAVLHWLRLGKRIGNQVEVLSGLKGNERIIHKANGKLYNGRNVSVAK